MPHKFIKKHLPYDWKEGNEILYDRYPPRIKMDEDITPFEDSLRETVSWKIDECIERQEELKSQRLDNLQNLETIQDPILHEMFKELIEAEWSEYRMIDRWINHWRDLDDRLNKKRYEIVRVENENGISGRDIEIARGKELINFYPGELKKFGNKMRGVCPFHEERTPSFFIFPDNHWYCFGACVSGGDIIDFIMKLKQLSFVEAVKYLL